MDNPNKLDVETLAQAVTDALTSIALVVARLTNKNKVIDLLTRYANALEQSGSNDAGAQLVHEMARVVGEIRDH